MAPLFWTWLFLTVTTAYGTHPFVVEGQADNAGVKQASEESSAIFSRRADFDDLDLDLDLTAEESANVPHTDDQPEARYRNPFPYAFNGGKPFSLLKDPITGQIDFEKAPPLKAVNFTDQYDDIDDTNDEETGKHVEDYLNRKTIKGKNGIAIGPNEINPFSPSFHDFLNLPVQYSSDKYGRDKYPLISSSYANTKVQSGSNLYSTYNHRPYHESTTRAPDVNVVTRRAYTTQSTTTTTEPTTTTTVSTTTTTTTTKAPKPTTTEKVTTTTKSTTSSEPPVTTWKPSTKAPSRYEEYDDILPIEKLQTPKYDNRPGPNDVPSLSTKPSIVDEYVYEDYEDESHEDHRYSVVTSSPKETTSPVSTTAKSEYRPSSSVSPPTTQKPTPAPEVTTELTKAPDGKPQPLVTSMPLDNENPMKDSPYENVVEGHRPEFANTVISGPGHVHFPNSHSGRPIAMLPESTSNIVIPPDQDTVSFVLGNRQNVEGSYYTHGSAGENTYSGVIGEGSFRPLISAGQHSHASSLIGHPSVSVVDHAPNPESNHQQWYKPRPPVSGSIFNFPMTSPLNSNPPGSNSPLSNDPMSDRPLSNAPGPNGPVSYTPGSDSSHSIPNAPITSSLLPHSPVSFPNSPTVNSSHANSPTMNEVDSSRPRPSVSMNEAVIQQHFVTDDKDTDYKNGYIVFPGPSKNQEPQRPVEEHVVIINEADGTIQEFTTTSTTMTPVDSATNKDGPPLPSEDLTPPMERPRPQNSRPPYYFHYQQLPTTRPEFPRPSRLPIRQKPPMEPVVFKRRPVTPDTKLPNILPQFRPNAKASHGHRGSETIGTIPAQVYHNRPRPPSSYSRRPSPPPSFLQRLSPPPPSHPVHHTLRINNLPKDDSGVQNSDVIVKRVRHPAGNPQGNSPVRDNERKPGHFPVALGQKQNSRQEDDSGDRYPAEPPQIPPRPVLFPRHRTDDNVPRVATLQMIQQRGNIDENVVRANLPPPLRGHLNTNRSEDSGDYDANRRKDEFRDSDENPADPPVYVVYPVNTAVNIRQDDSREKDESVVVGTHGPHRPLPPETLLQDEEANQTPEASPIVALPAKHYSSPIFASDFPYPLERPDPASLSGPVHETPLLVPSDQLQPEEDEDPADHDDRDTSVNIIPYLQDYVPFAAKKGNAISTTLQRLPLNSNLPSSSQSSTPIAYVFTPTAQPIIHRADIGPVDEFAKFDRGPEKPVLLPSQQPSSSSSSAPSPQSFMAPFIASANAEAPAKNGWNVVVVESNDRSSTIDENNKDALTAEDTQTERSEFDPDNFKPQLFGGFKPIYEFPTEDEASSDREIKDMPRSSS